MYICSVNYTAYQYRIKGNTQCRLLDSMSASVNFVWNYCNDVNSDSWKKFRKTYSAFDLFKLTSGCSSELGIHGQSIQAICEQYVSSCRQHKRTKLRWRTKKRSLGWVPFKKQCLKIKGDSVIYLGNTFKVWLSRPFPENIRCGSFTRNSKGNWFINLIAEDFPESRHKTNKSVGLDLGLKTIATLSDGVELNRESLTKQFEKQLAQAQRARKKKRVTVIHAKIKNKRKDWNHKASTLLIRGYDKIVVGNVSSSKLKKTRMAKSVSDAGWADLKQMLAYKAIRLGVEYKEVNESYSTVTCSTCSERTGPSGLGALGVRAWVCSGCGASHLRDVNAAKNILHYSVRGI